MGLQIDKFEEPKVDGGPDVWAGLELLNEFRRLRIKNEGGSFEIDKTQFPQFCQKIYKPNEKAFPFDPAKDNDQWCQRTGADLQQSKSVPPTEVQFNRELCEKQRPYASWWSVQSLWPQKRDEPLKPLLKRVPFYFYHMLIMCQLSDPKTDTQSEMGTFEHLGRLRKLVLAGAEGEGSEEKEIEMEQEVQKEQGDGQKDESLRNPHTSQPCSQGRRTPCTYRATRCIQIQKHVV